MIAHLDHPYVLAAAPLAAAAVVGLLLLARRRRLRHLARLGSPQLVGRLVPRAALGVPWVRAALLGIGVASTLVALAGPRWGSEERVIRAAGADLVLALDVSLSMLATDVRPSRLELMKAEARQLVAQAGDDRIGLVAFAGRGYVVSPLTLDREALGLFLERLDPSSAARAGSSLSQAIRQGADLLLAGRGEGARVLVILSDGEAHEGLEDVVTAARSAAAAGVAVITVGFGTAPGSSIPIGTAGGTVPKADQGGQVVVTRYNRGQHEAVARAAGGTFIDAATPDKVSRVWDAVSRLQSRPHRAGPGPDLRAQFQWFLVLAVIFIFSESLIPHGRVRRGWLPGAAGVAAMLVLMAAARPTGGAGAGRDGERLFRAGKYAEAAAAFERAVRGGDRSGRTTYNLGTALLAADRGQEAVQPLLAAANSEGSEIRFRAQFNLGLTYLRQGGVLQGEAAERAYAGAIAAYKAALQVHPSSFDAAWNYELANRRLAETRQQRESETVVRAEQLLDRAAQVERTLEARRQPRSQPPSREKDW